MSKPSVGSRSPKPSAGSRSPKPSSSRSPKPSNSRKSSLNLQPIEIIDLSRIVRLESEAFPPEEAASALDNEYRLIVAKKLCVVAFLEEKKDFIGYITGTAAADDTRAMTPEMIKNHDAYGNVLCIHSVVISEPYRRQGLGTEMMTMYLEHIRRQTKMKKILLLSKRHLIPFYENLSFRLIGRSAICQGKDTWYEMTRDV